MAAMQAESRIGALWQQRMAALREYSVVRDGNVFGAGLAGSCLFSSEYDRARALLENLVLQYDGTPFTSLFPGSEIETENGTCLTLEHREVFASPPLDGKRLDAEMLADLTLVRGIGERSAVRLKARGWKTIADLVNHPRFRHAAREVLDRLACSDPREIMDLAGSRHARSHPFVLGAACAFAPKDFVFLDIETLGLFSRPIILFGVGTIEQENFVVRQYLLRDISEEPAALTALAGHFAGQKKALVTFNGKAFDLPYVQDRLAYYGIPPVTRVPHFDVLHFARRRWKGQYPSCRLGELESVILGVGRKDDVPGQMVPEFYETYIRTKNCGPLVPIVSHNRQDVISTAHLFFYLLGETCGRC
ncbi:ribonuclease H-like domain-containing protein [Methanoregula sp.]|uniref:ribonuclease H-like domain-containing protein n=1 Tax=Methanoregula sp. TaxID=2052170 RepID=UPI002BCFCF2C|nr:ribonuclease H-like domain-containing protein [Methanoregula sp.]HVP96578.1 ribonuclease H-like domain-containing protein [Methanoregula sp.]